MNRTNLTLATNANPNCSSAKNHQILTANPAPPQPATSRQPSGGGEPLCTAEVAASVTVVVWWRRIWQRWIRNLRRLQLPRRQRWGWLRFGHGLQERMPEYKLDELGKRRWYHWLLNFPNESHQILNHCTENQYIHHVEINKTHTNK